MRSILPVPQQPAPDSSNSLWQSRLGKALRFWEPLRILYNAVLALFALIWLIGTWPHFRPALTWFHLVQSAVLVLLANVCYSAAYLVDVATQWSGLGREQRMLRWTVWSAGLLLAIVLENYWIADEIYPFVN
jgi:hypothetical protein